MAAPNVSQVVVVPDRPADVLPHILAVVGTDGYQLAARPDAGVVLSRRRIPVWAIVLAVVLFPFGLLFLLVRQDEIVNVSVHHVSGGTQVTIAGRASVQLQNAIQYAVGSYPGAAAGDRIPGRAGVLGRAGYSGAPGQGLPGFRRPRLPGAAPAPPPPPAPMSPREALAIQEGRGGRSVGRGSQAEAPGGGGPGDAAPGGTGGRTASGLPAAAGSARATAWGGCQAEGRPAASGRCRWDRSALRRAGGCRLARSEPGRAGAFGLGPLPSLGGPPGGGSVAPGGIGAAPTGGRLRRPRPPGATSEAAQQPPVAPGRRGREAAARSRTREERPRARRLSPASRSRDRPPGGASWRLASRQLSRARRAGRARALRSRSAGPAAGRAGSPRGAGLRAPARAHLRGVPGAEHPQRERPARQRSERLRRDPHRRLRARPRVADAPVRPGQRSRGTRAACARCGSGRSIRDLRLRVPAPPRRWTVRSSRHSRTGRSRRPSPGSAFRNPTARFTAPLPRCPPTARACRAAPVSSTSLVARGAKPNPPSPPPCRAIHDAADRAAPVLAGRLQREHGRTRSGSRAPRTSRSARCRRRSSLTRLRPAKLRGETAPARRTRIVRSSSPTSFRAAACARM